MSQNILFSVLIASIMVPFAVKIIPMFRMFAWGLVNNYLAIILPAVGTPFVIFFFRQNTLSFPRYTIHAADLCRYGNLRLHGDLEQLSVVFDRIAEQ